MAYSRSVIYQRKTDKGGNKQRERVIQVAYTKWLRRQYPDVDFFNDWAAGAYLTVGQNRSKLAMASDNGWVDTFLPEPRGPYHGLFIELKKEGVRPYLRNGNVSANPQIRKEHEFLLRQRAKGYRAEFACGLLEAQQLTDNYFGVERSENLSMF